MLTNLSFKIKVKGCFDCPFRVSDREVCRIIDSPHTLLDVVDNEYHKECPLDHVIVEVIKDNN